jgi:hypothetical protein
MDRVENLLNGTFDPVRMQRGLDAFTKKAAGLGRSVFRGSLGYAAAQDDEVDWTLFDIVGIDYYSYFRQPSHYIRELRRYQRWGEPVAITEFGTCAYRGAEKTAGMGWNVVDLDKNPEEIKGHLVRSEHTQAAYVVDLLEVFESMGLYGAMAFEFVTPDAPHRAHDPRPTTSTWRATPAPEPSRTVRSTRTHRGTGNRRRCSGRWRGAMPGVLTRPQ